MADRRTSVRLESMRQHLTAAGLGLLLSCALAACGGGGPDCRVGADCASGICRSDGSCAPLADGDGGDDGAADGGLDGGGDALADAGDGGGDAGDSGGDAGDGGGDAGDGGGDGSLTCAPDHDGVISRAEVPLRPGLRATFRVSGRTEIDTAGEARPGGGRLWDLTGPYDGDEHVLVELRDPTGTWFAPVFPEADYYSRLRQDEDLLGVFRTSDEALELLGVVSPDDGVLRTELTFDPPVTVYAFPLQQGDAWSTETTVSGWAAGAYSYYTEDYDNQVDAAGELITPYGRLQVLRVRSHMTRTVNLVTTARTVSHFFAAECFGTAAVIHSRDFESEPEFDVAAEVRRLAP